MATPKAPNSNKGTPCSDSEATVLKSEVSSQGADATNFPVADPFAVSDSLEVSEVSDHQDGFEEKTCLVGPSQPEQGVDLPPSPQHRFSRFPDKGEVQGKAEFTALIPNGLSPDALQRSLRSPPSTAPTLPERYALLKRLGEGGMGEVWEVFDMVLGHPVALKTLHDWVPLHSQPHLRLVDEGAVTAQLQHPGVVPVYDRGELSDGRPYFTMKVIQGSTLESLIGGLHRFGEVENWDKLGPGRTLRQLLQVVQKTCEAVAYAHSRGVIHRDLKPSNIMVGAFGEVLVLDWGLAKLPHAEPVSSPGRVGYRLSPGRGMTQVGDVSGTPAYMPPEQARYGLDSLDASADVYSMGGVLYCLMAGHSPYPSQSANEAIASLLAGAPPDLHTLSYSFSPDPELGKICLQAMERDPRRRYQDGLALNLALSQWLDGARRKEAALELVHRSDSLLPTIERARIRAVQLKEEAKHIITHLPAHAPVSKKLPGWRAEDRASDFEVEAAVNEVRRLQLLRGALVHHEKNLDALERLSSHYHHQHRMAEELRDDGLAGQLQVLLSDHDLQDEYGPYLEEKGWLTLETNPPGVTVTLQPYVKVNRYLRPAGESSLGITPLKEVSVGAGSYQLTLSVPGGRKVRYPILIPRGTHLIVQRPGDDRPTPIDLNIAKVLGRDDVFVAPGFFVSGGDPKAHNGRPRQRVWVDAFVIGRQPVTNGEYVAFLNDLIDTGREEVALQCVPRESPTRPGVLGGMIYHRRADGYFEAGVDGEGHLRAPDHPIVDVNWRAAATFGQWKAERDGLPWRLPHPLEWEKAARGADGRWLPWGDFPEPTWCCRIGSRDGVLGPTSILDFPEDVSPYGMRGAAGNVMDWCVGDIDDESPWVDESGKLKPIEREDPGEGFGIARGGFWYGGENAPRVANIWGHLAHRPSPYLGFRLVRSV